MDSLYNQEKKAIEARYLRTKHWYEGELQTYMQRTKPEFDGYVFWRDCYDADIRLLNAKYEKQFCLKSGRVVEDKHMWVGINPSYKYITDLYNDLVNSKVLRKYKYEAVVECHTENGVRPHIHMIIYTEERPNRIISKLANVFKCGRNFIDCKTSYDLEIHKKYLSGDKREEKKENVEKDRRDRDHLGIPHLIINN